MTLLTDKELALVTDAEVLLTKNRIVQKLIAYFSVLANDYKNIIPDGELTGIFSKDAKISRGENYKGLPYVVLDYPRQFGKEDVFAIRTFFWWGNFFSITLQLSGKFFDEYSAIIDKAQQENKLDDWSIGVGQNAWEYYFEEDNYRSLKGKLDFNITSLPFLKIAKKIPLQKWDESELFFKDNFKFLLKIFG